MSSVSIVKLLPVVCGLMLAVQLRTTGAEVSGFGFELLLTRLEAFQEVVIHRMDVFSQKLDSIEDELRKIRKDFSAKQETLSEKLIMFESTTAKELANLRNYIREHSSLMSTSMVHLSESGKQVSKHLEQRMEELTARSGVYTVKYNTSWSAFQVYHDGSQCHGYGGDWIVFQRRSDGSVNFNRPWLEYAFGFGVLAGEHWLGLEKLYHILVSERHELLIELESVWGNIVYAKYDDFQIGNEHEHYKIKSIGNYSGTAVDLLKHKIGHVFGTYDENDVNKCTRRNSGGWWHGDCDNTNLNGPFYNFSHERKGIHTASYSQSYYAKTKMMVRPYSASSAAKQCIAARNENQK